MFTQSYSLNNFIFKILKCLAFPYSESYIEDCIRCMPQLKKINFCQYFMKQVRLNNLCPSLPAYSIEMTTTYNEKMKNVRKYYLQPGLQKDSLRVQETIFHFFDDYRVWATRMQNLLKWLKFHKNIEKDEYKICEKQDTPFLNFSWVGWGKNHTSIIISIASSTSRDLMRFEIFFSQIVYKYNHFK